MPQNHKRATCDLTVADRLALYDHVAGVFSQEKQAASSSNDDLYVDLVSKLQKGKTNKHQDDPILPVKSDNLGWSNLIQALLTVCAPEFKKKSFYLSFWKRLISLLFQWIRKSSFFLSQLVALVKLIGLFVFRWSTEWTKDSPGADGRDEGLQEAASVLSSQERSHHQEVLHRGRFFIGSLPCTVLLATHRVLEMLEFWGGKNQVLEYLENRLCRNCDSVSVISC